MPAIWGDGYDCYAAPADATAGYWDSGTAGFTLVAGRFSGSQAIQNAGNTAWLVKTTTGTSDNNHHISCAFQQTAAISGTTLGMYLQLSDGATNQVCIVFRSDGAILLTSATPAGTVLATYTGAVTAASTWYQFEFEVVIHNTAGSFAVRKLGNTSNDFSASSLNTRPGANAQASKLTVGQNATVTSQVMDDLLWRSDTVSVSFSGDIRCFTRRPASDAAVQWSRSGAGTVPILPPTLGSAITSNSGIAHFLPFTPPVSGTISLVTIAQTVGASISHKAAIYASSGGVPTTVVGTATENTSSTIGTMNINFPTPVSVTGGTPYFVAFEYPSGTSGWSSTASATAGFRTAMTYASFPVASPGSLSPNYVFAPTVWLTPSGTVNWPLVSEQQQDAATTYVYSSNVGDSDLYGISSISSTPASIVAVTTRAYMQKSDAGTRNVAVQLKSGSTTVQGTSTALNTSWGWVSKVDQTDPATGAAWTAVGVANAQVGVIVTA